MRELDFPAAARARQLQATALWLLRLHFRFPQAYVGVNIAGASVEAVKDSGAERRFTAIVGGKTHKSPQLIAKNVSVDLNPTRTVPASIIKKEPAPRLRRDLTYFSREHIRALDARGREVDPRRLRHISAAGAARYTFRQEARF